MKDPLVKTIIITMLAQLRDGDGGEVGPLFLLLFLKWMALLIAIPAILI